MNIIKNILSSLLILFFNTFFSLSYSQNPFIENKGQLPYQVISKTNLPSGALFVEKGKFTYAFYNGEQLTNIHKGLKFRSDIDAHSYSVSFLNINNSYHITLSEQSKFYENYYLREESLWASNVRSYKTQLHNNIYDNIDLFYYVKDDDLKYDLIVDVGGQVNDIKMKYKGLKIFQLKMEI